METMKRKTAYDPDNELRWCPRCEEWEPRDGFVDGHCEACEELGMCDLMDFEG